MHGSGAFGSKIELMRWNRCDGTRDRADAMEHTIELMRENSEVIYQINYKMTVQYEGTRYKGWQRQPRVENTIQGKLETLLSRLLDTDIEVFGAGRTDAGVHALGQTASFRASEEKLASFAQRFPSMKASWSGAGAKAQAKAAAGTLSSAAGTRPAAAGALSSAAGTRSAAAGSHPAADSALSPDSDDHGPDLPADPSADRSRQVRLQDAMLLEAVNHYLPEDIAIPRLTRASDRFHARYLTSSKWYQYRIRTAPFSDVRDRRFQWQYGEDLDTDAMLRASRALIGTHDFTSFCGLKMKKSAVRTITDIRISRPDEYTIVLDYYGDGFLNHMVRLLTGELTEVGAHRSPEDAIGRILAAQKKGAASHTAPASGLTLMKVNY